MPDTHRRHNSDDSTSKLLSVYHSLSMSMLKKHTLAFAQATFMRESFVSSLAFPVTFQATENKEIFFCIITLHLADALIQSNYHIHNARIIEE